MNLFPQSATGQLPRGWSTVAIFALSVAIAYKSASYIVADDLSGLLFMGLIFVVLAFVAALLRNWRNGVYLFLGWLLFEDLARKFLGNNMAVYFAKDLLLLLVYLSFFAAYRRKERGLETFRPAFLPILLVFVWYAAMQVFNPAATSIFYGLLGMKLYFYYVPLIVIGYAMVNSETELRRFFYINLGLMLVIAVLGIIQSTIGPRFLNPAVMADDIRLLSETYRVAPITGARVYRPTSVFVSTGRFGDLLVVDWFLVFGFSGYLLLRERKGRLLAFAALTVTAAACVMCGSRGVFMWALGSGVVGAAAFIWGAPWRQNEALRVFRTLQRAVLGVALAGAVLFFLYPDEFLGRLSVYSETLDPRSPSSELMHRTRDYPMRNFLAAFDYARWPYGYGIGGVSLGGQYIARIFKTPPAVGGVESGFGAIVVEIGILGLALWIIVSLAIVRAAWKVTRTLRGSTWFPLAFMIVLYTFVVLIPMTFVSMGAYQDFIVNAYMWLLLGILFRLPKLAQSPRPPVEALATQPDNRWVR